jgi:hypothetical protein
MGVVSSGHTFLKSPRWHDGRVGVSDFHTRRVLAVAPDGATEVVAHVPGQPGGLGFAPDGSLLAPAGDQIAPPSPVTYFLL